MGRLHLGKPLSIPSSMQSYLGHSKHALPCMLPSEVNQLQEDKSGRRLGAEVGQQVDTLVTTVRFVRPMKTTPRPRKPR